MRKMRWAPQTSLWLCTFVGRCILNDHSSRYHQRDNQPRPQHIYQKINHKIQTVLHCTRCDHFWGISRRYRWALASNQNSWQRSLLVSYVFHQFPKRPPLLHVFIVSLQLRGVSFPSVVSFASYTLFAINAWTESSLSVQWLLTLC